MSYILKNMRSTDCYLCDDQYWDMLLSTARNEGWKPEGTHYDFLCQVDEYYDEGYESMHNLFMVVLVTQWYNSWDGNYYDKENQYLSDEDVYYLKLALNGTGVDPAFLDFLEKGSFRICSI
ncbi:MAG TPA: hypothetical protein PK926_09995 [Spirochaetota bacterium]|nr:hypothetical protein [Spirochaetota bacterium]HPI91026.1 hypothetical protein [Spirochaetota bacterium]HPR47654.1 hypothetical protein [Spirochaetota bacterium]